MVRTGTWAVVLVIGWGGLAMAADSPWEKEIKAFEAADKEAMPPGGGTLFTGSSTIRLWTTLARDLPDHAVINRGFGGSEIADATAFADRIIIPYRPATVVIRAGGNDIHNGKPPEKVFADFRAFVAKVRGALPEAKIAYISIAPTIARKAEVARTDALNGMIRDYLAKTPNTTYIDATDMTLAADGTIRPELFVADGLHFSPAGYKLLTERVRTALGSPARAKAKAEPEPAGVR